MAGIQFAHVNWYAKTAAKKRDTAEFMHGKERSTGWSVADILAEAERKKGNCPHVPDPMAPRLLHGVPLDQVEALADAWAATQTVSVKLKNGTVVQRKMRSDAPRVAAGVMSLPKDRLQDWPAFRDNAIKQLEKKYGDRLVSAVEHLDEPHPHLHYYLVPLAGESFGAVHEGYAASREARQTVGNKIRAAFNSAMNSWQEWIHQTIAEPFHLARLGPRRARTSRKKWLEDEKERDLALRIARVTEQEQQIVEQKESIQKKINDLDRRELLITKKTQEVDQNEITQAKKQKEIDRLKVEITQTYNELLSLLGTAEAIQEFKNKMSQREPKIISTLKKPT